MQIRLLYEVYRKAIHLSSLIYPFFYWFVDKSTTLVVIGIITFCVILWDILRIRNIELRITKIFQNCLRFEERSQKKISGATWFLLSTLVVVAFFPKSIAIMSMLVLIFADTVAALVGRTIGKIRLLDKTLEGSLAFFITGYLIIYIYTYFVDMEISGYLIFFTMLFTTMGELLAKEIKIDDNLLITLLCASMLNFY